MMMGWRAIGRIAVVLALSATSTDAGTTCGVPTPEEMENAIMTLWQQEKFEDLELYLLEQSRDHPKYVPAIVANAFYESLFRGDSVDAIAALQSVLSVSTSDGNGDETEEFRSGVEMHIHRLERIRDDSPTPEGHGGSVVEHARGMKKAFDSTLLPGVPPPIVDIIGEAPPLYTETAAAPSVSISSPSDGAVIAAESEVPVKLLATAVGGAICEVEVVVSGVSIGTDQEAPYEVTWGEVAPGTYELQASARDFRGGMATSTTITVERP